MRSLSARARSVSTVLGAVLALNLAVTLVKLVVGLRSGAIAVLADAFHSLVDSSSNIVGLLGVWAAARPPDADHPYGHHKYETLAALGIGGLLLLAGLEIGEGVVGRLAGKTAAPEVTPLILALMAFTFLVNILVVTYETRQGRRLQSPILLADAAHTRADLFITLSVIASLVGARWGLSWLDPLTACLVLIFLVRAAWGILRSSTEVMTDAVRADPEEVRRVAASVPGVRSVGSVRSRGRHDAVYVDLDLAVDPTLDTVRAHAVASEAEGRIREAMPAVVDVVVHVEPGREPVPANPWEGIARRLRDLGDGIGVGVHDVHVHADEGGRFTVEVHLEVEAGLALGEAHQLADRFERRAQELLPEARAIVSHLEPLPGALHDAIAETHRTDALRLRITRVADGVAGAGTCHEVEVHRVDGHLTASLHVFRPADEALTASHAVAEAIERALHADLPGLHRVIVHVEPPE